MKVLRRVDFPEKKYSIAVVGFGPEDSHFVIEMRYCMSNNLSEKHSFFFVPFILL